MFLPALKRLQTLYPRAYSLGATFTHGGAESKIVNLSESTHPGATGINSFLEGGDPFPTRLSSLGGALIDSSPITLKYWYDGGSAYGTEFGSEKGKVMLVVRAIYGLKSSGADWRQMLAQTLRNLGYVSSKADPDVWLKAKFKPDGTELLE